MRCLIFHKWEFLEGMTSRRCARCGITQYIQYHGKDKWVWETFGDVNDSD